MVELEVGMKAPVFSLPDALGKKVSLKDFFGKWVVVYFYPKDDTPGCTIEALDFTKFSKEFLKLKIKVLGISKDNCVSHQKFIDKHKLNLELLSDVDHKLQESFGVWRKKKFMGREYLGTVRSTFLIDKKGKIVNIWDDISAKGHANEVLEYIKTNCK